MGGLHARFQKGWIATYNQALGVALRAMLATFHSFTMDLERRKCSSRSSTGGGGGGGRIF